MVTHTHTQTHVYICIYIYTYTGVCPLGGLCSLQGFYLSVEEGEFYCLKETYHLMQVETYENNLSAMRKHVHMFTFMLLILQAQKYGYTENNCTYHQMNVGQQGTSMLFIHETERFHLFFWSFSPDPPKRRGD